MNATGTSVVVEEEGAARETAPVSTSSGKKLAQSELGAAKAGRVDLDNVFVSKAENVRALGSAEYSDESIGELAAQIEAVGGLLQPIAVFRVKPTADTDNKDVALAWGFRRFYALMYLADTDPKWKMQVPCRFIEKGVETTGTTRLIQLIENVGRKDLNAMETAQGIQEALNDKECDFNQQDIARILGMSASAVSHHLKMLRFPKAVQDAISNGNLQFSHARDILYRVPETAWATAAKKASGMIYADFKAWLDKEYPADDGEDGEVTASGEKASSQKAAKMLRATDVTNKYVPFLEKQVKEANTTEKAFTAADVAKAKLDAVKTVLLNPDTELAHDIDPFLKQLEEQEAQATAAEEATKAEEAFFKGKVKRIEELYDVPVDPAHPDAERPKLTQVYAQVGGEVFSLSAEDKAKLGFKLTDNPDELVQKLAATYDKVVKDRIEAKQKRDKAKADKKAADAAKTPAGQAS